MMCEIRSHLVRSDWMAMPEAGNGISRLPLRRALVGDAMHHLANRAGRQFRHHPHDLGG